MNKLLLLFFLLISGLHANAQENKFPILLTTGVSTTLLDNGIGLHLGVNPTYTLSSRFSIEGQVSYLYTKVDAAFISGDEEIINSVNTLIGGRLYLNSAEKINRFYLNLLLGGNYNREKDNGVQQDGEFGLGASFGAFLELNKFLVGLSFDTPQNIILKVGYIL